MASDEHHFRRLARGDEEALSRLAGIVLKEDVPPSFWTWKYLDNRWGPHYSYVAESDGQIVGFVGGMAWQLTVQGKACPGTQVTDLMLDPTWRRKGIFFPLNAKSQEEIFDRATWHYGVTNPVSFRIFQNRYGYQGFRPNKIQKILDIRPFIREYLKNRNRLKLPGFGGLVRKILSLGRKAQRPAGLTLEEVARFDERFDDLWIRVRDGYGIISTRDHQHLNWRYLDNPRVDYTVLASRDNDRITGFVVLKYERSEGIGRGFIVDFLADPNHAATTPFLIAEALRFFRRRKAAVVNTWMFEHCHPYETFASFGFTPRTAETVMILTNSLTDAFSKDFMADVKNWYFAMGDCEVF